MRIIPVRIRLKSPHLAPSTCRYKNIRAEVEAFFDVHEELGTVPGGIHLEMTGDNVTGHPIPTFVPSTLSAFKHACMSVTTVWACPVASKMAHAHLLCCSGLCAVCNRLTRGDLDCQLAPCIISAGHQLAKWCGTPFMTSQGAKGNPAGKLLV